VLGCLGTWVTPRCGIGVHKGLGDPKEWFWGAQGGGSPQGADVGHPKVLH